MKNEKKNLVFREHFFTKANVNLNSGKTNHSVASQKSYSRFKVQI
jgi:hypothetical protein